MASQYERVWKELHGHIAEITPEVAKTCVAESWEAILHSKETWSFLDVVGAIVATVNQIIAGTVAVTEDSDEVVADVTAKAALDAVGSTALIGRQFRVNQSVFPTYTITAYDTGTGTLTLDRVYLEESNAATEYLVFQVYYPVPEVNFSHWLSIYDPVESRLLTIDRSQQQLNRYDPQRATADAPFAVYAYKWDTPEGETEPRPYYEWYPAPTEKRGYVCAYRKLTQPFDADNPLPGVISELLVKQGAFIRAYEWCEAI